MCSSVYSLQTVRVFLRKVSYLLHFFELSLYYLCDNYYYLFIISDIQM